MELSMPREKNGRVSYCGEIRRVIELVAARGLEPRTYGL